VGLLRRGKERQSSRERSELRNHLRELGELREEKLRELGEVAAGMQAARKVDRTALWEKAAEAASVEDEAELVHRGLKEKLTIGQLEELARGEAPGGGEAAAESSDTPPAAS
jgi:hypothetical protein